MGNKGVIGSGDIQWMTAGSGIIHQEMPKGRTDGLLRGFQLWANLPASHKMMDPRYREIKRDQIPEITIENGAKVKIICGEVQGVRGPITYVVIDPEYLDVTVAPNTTFSHPVQENYTVFAYLLEGEGFFDEARGAEALGAENLIIFDNGSEVRVLTEEKPVRFLLVSGRPLKEPVAWYGPVVMNTREELDLAFEEYKAGTFIKHPQ
jgi:redox-sensitive bicupin YhaK (pirin superfamily)